MEAVESEIGKISLITKRDVERKLCLQKRNEEKINSSAENERLPFFEKTFSQKSTEISDLLLQSHDTKKEDLPDHFNNISKLIVQLQKYVANCNIFLRTYDIKKCQETLQELFAKLKELEEQLLPKKKFGFKNKTKKFIEKKPGTDEVDFQHKFTLPKQICGFTDQSNETLTMEREEVYKKDVTIERMENCKVYIYGAPSTLHMNYLRNCQIFSGPVSTSIFAENCIDCTLVIACQQLRLHASRNVIIYLHVTSRAIMEDCSEIFLAPYNLNYPGIEKDFAEAGLDKSTNNWRCVDDFNWLNLEKQSPNWSVLEEI